MSWRNIPVLGRSEVDETPARPFGMADASDLDDIIRTVRAWGFDGNDRQVVGQFTELGFEFIIVENDG